MFSKPGLEQLPSVLAQKIIVENGKKKKKSATKQNKQTHKQTHNHKSQQAVIVEKLKAECNHFFPQFCYLS